ncbi:MAG: DUF6455 family protein [Bosea sp. (in: a-proteobacteria)]
MRGWIRRRFARQAQLMGAMMERIGFAPEEAGVPARALAAASRRCLFCPSAQQCGQWLEQTQQAESAPEFCPNAGFFADRRRG